MKVPLLDLKAQYAGLREETLKAVSEVLESQYFIGGACVSKLEEAVAAYSGTSHAVGVSSGTDALLVSLMSAGVCRSPLDEGPAPEVIVPAYTFFATAGSVWRAGAKPVFADIDADTYNIDPESAKSKLTELTRAIIPVHLYGQCADMKPISDFAKAAGLFVIEDAAQSIGARQNGVCAGNFGDCACLSFFPSKNLGGLGDGGMVLTNSEDFARRVREMRNHGMEPKYFHKRVGGNFRLDAIQAAGLLVKLACLDEWGRMRRANAAVYDEAFAKIDEIKTPAIRPENYSIYNQYVISVPNRDEVLSRLRAADIGCEIYYPLPLHMQECFAPLGYREGDFPNSEYAAKHTLALPIYPELSREQLDYVAGEVVKAVLKK
ncbi:MAG: transcriptional regulator [Verrucomicrobia bacterium]|nr:MAG: transcriptional regulator [Verrucomicrobiota bacterium]